MRPSSPAFSAAESAVAESPFLKQEGTQGLSGGISLLQALSSPSFFFFF